MNLFPRSAKAIALGLLPVFLAASVLCVCGWASAAEVPATGGHACCPESGPGSPESQSTPGDHRGDCNHCGQSQIAAGEAANVPLPLVTPIAWAAAVSALSQMPIVTSPAPARAHVSLPYPPGPLFSLKCALLI